MEPPAADSKATPSVHLPVFANPRNKWILLGAVALLCNLMIWVSRQDLIREEIQGKDGADTNPALLMGRTDAVPLRRGADETDPSKSTWVRVGSGFWVELSDAIDQRQTESFKYGFRVQIKKQELPSEFVQVLVMAKWRNRPSLVWVKQTDLHAPSEVELRATKCGCTVLKMNLTQAIKQLASGSVSTDYLAECAVLEMESSSGFKMENLVGDYVVYRHSVNGTKLVTPKIQGKFYQSGSLLSGGMFRFEGIETFTLKLGGETQVPVFTPLP